MNDLLEQGAGRVTVVEGEGLTSLHGAEPAHCGGPTSKPTGATTEDGAGTAAERLRLGGGKGRCLGHLQVSYLICIPGLTFNFICIHYSQWGLEWFLKWHKIHLNCNGKTCVQCDALITVKLTLGCGECQFPLAA